MNKIQKFNFLLNYKIFENFYIYLVLLSYFFLWDINFQGISLKYSIFLIFFFIFIKKINIKKLKFSIYLLFFLISHLLINKFIFNIPLTIDNAKGVVLMFTSFLFVSVFKERIIDTLHNLYTYFPIMFVPLTLFTIKHDSVYFTDLNFKCSFLMFNSKFFNRVFLENSHYGMILPSLIIYNLYLLSIENRSFYKNYIRYISLSLLIISSFLYGSTTLNFGLIVSIIFLLIFVKQYKNFFTISLLLFLASYSLIFNTKSACNSKISDLSVYFDKAEIHKINIKENNDLLQEYEELSGDIEKLKIKKNNLIDELQFILSQKGIKSGEIHKLLKLNNLDLIIIELESMHSISDNLIIEKFDYILEILSILDKAKVDKGIIELDITKNENEINTNFNVVNVSTQVILKSIITSIKSFLDNPIGYGVNSYEYAYFKYNPIEVKKAFFGADTFFINYNDAASNFPKILTEFGVFNLLIIILFILFIFDKNINLKYKILILPLILTLNLRAAGYFNSGYFICIVLVFFLLKDRKYDYTK